MLLKNKLRLGKPEEKKAVRLKPETVAVGTADDLVRELKDASLLARLNRREQPMFDPATWAATAGRAGAGIATVA